MEISESIKYVGVDDRNIDLFEGQFAVPNGMAYNSYVIIDEKCAVMDSVDGAFGDEWLSHIEGVLGAQKPDFLVVHHMEMDHSANVLRFAQKYPEAKIVASKVAFAMMKNMFGTDFSDRQIVAAEGFSLSLGKHELRFIAAPNVHWPEVLMSFESAEGVLFSADAFGKFGANNVADDDWACEARRYYFGIVGKFGQNVQAVLKKVGALNVAKICPLHGPVLSENLEHYLSLYDIWSSYKSETEGVAIAYTSVYGHTKAAAEKLCGMLKERGVQTAIFDLARSDIHECVEDAFRYSKLVLATTTYNGAIFPAMQSFIAKLTERNFQNRTVAFIENGSWAPVAAKNMENALSSCKNLQFCQNKITIKIAMTGENEKQLSALADELSA